jgi:hypothetical protein
LNAIIGITEMLQESARDFNRDDEIEPPIAWCALDDICSP